MKIPYKLILVMCLAAGSAPAQWLDRPTAGIPRTADGAPDLAAPAPRTSGGRPELSGLWVARGVTGDLPTSDKFRDWAMAAIEQRAARFFADQPRYNCLPSGPGYLTAGSTSGGLRRFVQTPSMLAILYEDLAYRQIFMDGRQLEDDPLPTWMGYSVGHWDGDVLVVESNGYNDKTWLDRRGAPHTGQLRITERYQRRDFGHMTVDVIYDDPGAFEAPLHAVIQMAYVADDELLEVVCNETAQTGNDWSGSIAQAEASAVAVAPDVLAAYVGTFEGTWLGNVITLEFALDEGELTLRRNGVDLQLVPQSETAFDCSNGFAYIFTPGEDGRAREVTEVHVSGGWPFPRKEPPP